MGFSKNLTWGPEQGDMIQMLPRMSMDVTPRDWLLFKTERKSAPRPWVSGTLMLVNLQIHMGPEHLPFLSIDDPLLQTLSTLSKPLLLMSEHVCREYTLGSGWAIMDCESPAVMQLVLSGTSWMKRTRFMEFLGEDMLGNFIQTFDYNDEITVYSCVRELDGRRNAIEIGYLFKNSMKAVSLLRRIDVRNCSNCVYYTCSCDTPEVSEDFEIMSMTRRNYAVEIIHGSNLGNQYFQSWVDGNWTGINVGSPMPPFRFVISSFTNGMAFDQTLSFVIQTEVAQVNPPRASQRFISYLLAEEEHGENEWSKIVEVGSEAGDVKPAVLEKIGKAEKKSRTDLIVKRNVKERDRIAATDSPVSQPRANLSQNAKNSKIFPCPKCNLTFKRRYDMNRHMRNVHEKRRDHECQECGQLFTQSGHLNEHINVVHAKSTSHTCIYCAKVFGAKSKLERHVLSVHEDLRLYSCSQCERTFKDPSSVKYHMSAAHSEKELQVAVQ